MVKRLLQCVHHFQHALLTFRTKGHIDISLSQRFAQLPVGKVHAALPTRLNLFLARELLLKLEVGIHEWLRKPRSGSIQHMPAYVGLQRIQRLRFQHAVHLLEEIRIRDIELRKPGCADRREVAIQIKIGTERRRLVAAHLMIAVLRITALGAVH